MVRLLNEGLREAKISQRKLAQALETDQGSISRKLNGERSFRLDEISTITSLILEQISPLSRKTTSEVYVSSENTVSVFLDDSVDMAARKMREGGFTQLPVIDRRTGKCKGMVTDFTLLKRMLSPSTVSKEEWLQNLGKMTLKDANMIDIVPNFPLTSSLIEIAQALIYHYAVLVEEADKKVGIVTRADFLKLLCNQK